MFTLFLLFICLGILFMSHEQYTKCTVKNSTSLTTLGAYRHRYTIQTHEQRYLVLYSNFSLISIIYILFSSHFCLIALFFFIDNPNAFAYSQCVSFWCTCGCWFLICKQPQKSEAWNASDRKLAAQAYQFLRNVSVIDDDIYIYIYGFKLHLV